MACNENIIKNIANEITRNCQASSACVDPEFVIYVIDLLLLNPKYGKLFARTINRSNLQYFVEECANILLHGGVSISTLKMQYIIQTNYDKLQNLIDKHLDTIQSCLKPLINEILEEDPDSNNEAEFKKLFRKISIYIILASGLGNPGVIVTLKEGMAALESVLSMDDLKVFVALPRPEKVMQLNELLEIVSGVRLFNRDCKKGGEGIPDLPFNLVEAGKACLALLSNCLIAVMQRVNTLTTAIEDSVIVQEETGNVMVDVTRNPDVTLEEYKLIFDLLAFNRQYEVFIRKLLTDVESMVQRATEYVERVKEVLEGIHAAVKYKAAVPVVAVFPLFSKLWQVWRGMQNIMFLVSSVNRLVNSLGNIQDQMKIPYHIVDKMLKGRQVVSDQERMNCRVSIDERISLTSLSNYVAYRDSLGPHKERHIQYLGFCAMCLGVGALVPSNVKVGLIKARGQRFGFCNIKMATRFSKEPERYINEVLDHARNNPHLVNLLNIVEDVYRMKDIDNLVVKRVPKIKLIDNEVQTDIHPYDEWIEKDYSWDLWEWKRRSCQWASIVNCKTHSTQTHYSHLRSEIHCQTVELRDKCHQTNKECGVNTVPKDTFIWGLRARAGQGQQVTDLTEKNFPNKAKAQAVTTCCWPCVEGADGSPINNTRSNAPAVFRNVFGGF